ncbi:hypothetical protein L1987_62577 [Smallanthus sonchifolius]|uniref:Uncharacterized protein n=1 Tax=Smallanthus sonchifolius TaxID=185202 RepID=A0ACB9CAS7_9ASTR|nr:hypothetical protein L1987_62577 [Smallanthus sonchifolius]
MSRNRNSAFLLVGTDLANSLLPSVLTASSMGLSGGPWASRGDIPPSLCAYAVRCVCGEKHEIGLLLELVNKKSNEMMRIDKREVKKKETDKDRS